MTCDCGRHATKRRLGTPCCDRCAEIEARMSADNHKKHNESGYRQRRHAAMMRGRFQRQLRSFKAHVVEFWYRRGMQEPETANWDINETSELTDLMA